MIPLCWFQQVFGITIFNSASKSLLRTNPSSQYHYFATCLLPIPSSLNLEEAEMDNPPYTLKISTLEVPITDGRTQLRYNTRSIWCKLTQQHQPYIIINPTVALLNADVSIERIALVGHPEDTVDSFRLTYQLVTEVPDGKIATISQGFTFFYEKGVIKQQPSENHFNEDSAFLVINILDKVFAFIPTPKSQFRNS